eukprot:9474244-Pyramimonas_sp.AAC.1
MCREGSKRANCFAESSCSYPWPGDDDVVNGDGDVEGGDGEDTFFLVRRKGMVANLDTHLERSAGTREEGVRTMHAAPRPKGLR